MSHAKTLKINVVNEKPVGPFKFTDSFKNAFKSMIDEYSNALEALNKLIKHNSNSEYGVCACCYNLRYLKPTDVSTYIGNLDKAFSSGMLSNNLSDVSMFAVASVKRFLEENECTPFEEASMLAPDRSYVNPKEFTLSDLMVLCENDICGVSVYSQAEIQKRMELAKKDADIFNKMHFSATMKNVVDKLPNVMNAKSGICNPIGIDAIREQIEEFILFACALNTICVYSIIRYIDPEVIFAMKEKENKQIVQEGFYTKETDTTTSLSFANVVTECCTMLKTNDMMIRSKIPFNCNMRDVVLQDMTPDFADTRAAIHFLMKDTRSPIAMLVNKYCTSNTNSNGCCNMIVDMFMNHYNEFSGFSPTQFDKKNSQMIPPNAYESYCKVAHTNVNWLDTIAYGNNYLDGNHRRDTVGNNHVHPIENTLSMLYRIYGGCDLQTNEELADNIIKVSCTMNNIINEYPEGFIDNYAMVKDILCVFGEIMTRNMLRLYYNNTRVYDYSDDMPDAMTEPFLESFIMEADENTATNNTNNQNQSTRPGVTFQNAKGQTNMTGAQKGLFDIGAIIRKFVLWVQNSMAKLSGNFKERHKKEIEWVNKNEETNRRIAAAIQNKLFNPVLSNFPKYKILAKDLIDQVNIDTVVKKYLDSNETIDETTVIKEMLPSNAPTLVLDVVVTGVKGNDKKSANAIKNYILTGTAEEPQKINGPLTSEIWNDIIENIKGAQTLIDAIVKKYSDDLNKASKDIEAKQKEAQSLQKQEGKEEEGKQKLERATIMFNIVTKKIAAQFQTETLNTIIRDFYGVSYSMYRDIVAGYQQQSKNGQLSNNTNATNNTNQQQNSDQLQPTT